MSIILNILLWILIIILVLILIVLYALLSKRSFFIEYTKLEGLIIKVRLLFFKFTIYKSLKEEKKLEEKPIKEKPIKEKTIKEKPKQKTQKPIKEKKNIKDELLSDLSFSEIFSIIKDAVNSINGLIAVLAKKIKFTNICFTIPIHSENPLKTQKMYGSVTNAFYLLSTKLQEKFFISYENPAFVPDFENLLKDKEYFFIKITARTGFLLAVLMYVYKQYIYYKKTYLTKNKNA